MTEQEYLIATNRVKVSLALNVLGDVRPGDDLGITQDELSEITKRLCVAIDKLFSMIEIKGE